MADPPVPRLPRERRPYLRGVPKRGLGGDHDRWRTRSSLYGRWQEWEAETGATILSELASLRARPHVITKNAGRSDRAIAAAFGLSDTGWR